MGKKKGKSSYEHKHTSNPSARESDERRLLQLRNMEVRRLQKNVERQETQMVAYIPEHLKKRPRIDPNYNLTGAARPAREFYKDPNYVEEPEPEDIFHRYENDLWGHSEGQVLLEKLYELGVGLHNVGNRSKEAVEVFLRMLRQDPQDHLLARRALLRCYLDMGYGLEARELLDTKYPDDSSACFSWSRVMIEFVAHFLMEEEDSSVETVEKAAEKAAKANPYVVWTLIHHSTFTDVVEHLSELGEALAGSGGAAPGGILEALEYFNEDSAIWLETEGAVEWLADFAKSHPSVMPFPPPPDNNQQPQQQEDEDSTVAADVVEGEAKSAEGGDVCGEEGAAGKDDGDAAAEDEDDEEEGVEILSPEEALEMYVGMYHTAIEMVEAGV